jgi:hypothetical protein
LTLQNADNIANTPQTFIVRFSVSTWIVSPVFFLGFAKLDGILDFMALFVFTFSMQPTPQA